MVRRHGWAGSPPADEHEARARIIEAAMRCLDRTDPAHFSLSEVASELGVTRPTVYRYFPGTDDLFFAVAQVANETFIDALTARLNGITEPATWVVEALVAAVERVPDSRYLTLVLAAGRSDSFARSFTSRFSRGTGRELLKRSAVDWSAAGYTDLEREELVEHMLRTLQSLLVDPPDPPRSESELRRYLHRWVAPTVRRDATGDAPKGGG